jgi:hypothetical protein
LGLVGRYRRLKRPSLGRTATGETRRNQTLGVTRVCSGEPPRLITFLYDAPWGVENAGS